MNEQMNINVLIMYNTVMYQSNKYFWAEYFFFTRNDAVLTCNNAFMYNPNSVDNSIHLSAQKFNNLFFPPNR